VALEPLGTDECAVPSYHKPSSIDLPKFPESHFECVVEEYWDLFHTTPGVTEPTYCVHCIYVVVARGAPT